MSEDWTGFAEKLNDEEKSVVRCLAQLHEKSSTDMLGLTAVERETGLSKEAVQTTSHKLNRRKLLKYGDQSQCWVCVNNSIFDLMHEIENPPAPNHWNNLIDWWFSKRWSLPVTALVVLLPLIAQWIEMLKTVVGWVSPTE